MAEPEHLEVVHAIPGRARLRARGRQGDGAFFTELAQRLARQQAVREVRASARTGSLLVLHEGKLSALLDQLARELPLSVVADRATAAPMYRLQQALRAAEKHVNRRTAAGMSVGVLTFVSMVAAGVYQLRRGKFFPAGMTLFEYALRAMEREAERESASLRP